MSWQLLCAAPTNWGMTILPLERVCGALAKLWSAHKAFIVADMTNDFYFINCKSKEMFDKLLWDGFGL